MVIAEFTQWTKDVFVPLGPAGLFVVAFMESSFFPIPPDLLLIPLALAMPQLALFYAAVATAGSVLGALLGYYIGLKGGRPVLKKIANKKIGRVEHYFSRYGDWAIGIAGFTPIPYKIFTIAAGAMRYSISKLLVVSVISRGARFFLVAGIAMLWGEAIISLIDSYFAAFTVLAVGAVP